MSVDILSEEDVERIALSKMCEYIDSDEWCEDGSVLLALRRNIMDIKMLQKQVKALQKQAHIMTGVVTTMAEMLERKV